MSKKLVLLSVLVACVVTLGMLIVLNKERILTLYKNSKLTATNLNKSTITQNELDESLDLEKLLQPLDETQALATGSSKAKSQNKIVLDAAAKERVMRRKILEKEAPSLGLNLTELQNEATASPAIMPDGRLIPRPDKENLANLFSYDTLLLEKAKEKVEGFVEKQMINVYSNSPSFGNEAQKLAQEIAKTYGDAKFNLDEFKNGQKISSGISLQEQSFKNVGLSAVSQAEPVGKVKVQDSPFGFDVVKIANIEKGLGMGFDEWYGKAKNNYHE